jgi:O-antigen/teichoic acid export membrane protein
MYEENGSKKVIISKNYKFVFDGIFFGLGQSSQRAIALITLPFFITFIDPVNYGVVGLLTTFSVFIVPIFTFGLSSSIGVAYFDPKKKNRSDVISIAFLLSIIGAISFLSVSTFFLDSIVNTIFSSYEYKAHTYVVILTITFSILCIPRQLQQQYLKQSKTFLYFTMFSAFISVITSFVTIVILKYGALGLLIGSLFGQVALFILLSKDIKKLLKFNRSQGKKILKELVTFGLPMIPSFFLIFIIQNIMRWSLQMTDGLSAVGIFSLGASFGAIVNIAASGFASAWLPYTLNQASDWSKAKYKISKNLFSYFTYGSIVIIIVFLIAQPVLYLVAPPIYFNAWLVLGLIASSHFIVSLWNMIIPPLYINKKIVFVIIPQTIAALITLLIAFNFKGILGAGLASLFGCITLLFVQIILNRKILKQKSIPIPFIKYMKIIVFTTSVAVTTFFINIQSLSHFIIVELILITATLFFFYKINKNIVTELKFFILVLFEKLYKILFVNKVNFNVTDKKIKKKNVLFLCNRPSNNSQASTVTEYLDALKKYSNYNVFEISMLHQFPSRINLEKFDVIVTHYSLSLGPLLKYYYGKKLIEKIKKFEGLKVSFLQDEYRQVETYWQNINELGIDVLFSTVPEKEIQKVYPSNMVPNLKVVNVLTGYVPESLLGINSSLVKNRSIDVGYRSRKTPFWLGKLGFEKFFISEEFKRRSKNYNIKTNFSTKEGDRLYGQKWIDFVSSCKSLIGVESGASIVDFDGSLEMNVNSYVEKNPHATFDEVFNKFLKPYEGNVNFHQISPRCFEAIVLRTPLILFEGKYSGILKKNKHFIPLKKDFSNFHDVMKKLKNYNQLQKMANIAYDEIALNPKYSYRQFIFNIEKIINLEFKKRGKKMCNKGYTIFEFNKDINLSIVFIVRRKLTIFLQRIFLGNPTLRSFVFKIWETLPVWVQELIRPLARMISR